MAAEEGVVGRDDGARVPGEPVPALRRLGCIDPHEGGDPGVVRTRVGELVEDGGQPFEGVVGAHWHQAAVEDAAEVGAGFDEGIREAPVVDLIEDVVGVVRGVLEAAEPGEEGGVGRAALGALHRGGVRVEAEEVVLEALEVGGGGLREGEVAKEVVGVGAEPAAQVVEERRHQPPRGGRRGRTRHGSLRGLTESSMRGWRRDSLAGSSVVGGGGAIAA